MSKSSRVATKKSKPGAATRGSRDSGGKRATAKKATGRAAAAARTTKAAQKTKGAKGAKGAKPSKGGKAVAANRKRTSGTDLHPRLRALDPSERLVIDALVVKIYEHAAAVIGDREQELKSEADSGAEATVYREARQAIMQQLKAWEAQHKPVESPTA